MKKFLNRIIAVIMAITLTFGISIPALAADTDVKNNDKPIAHHVEYEVSSNGLETVTYDGIQTCSSISGYENATFTGGGGHMIVVPVVSSGVGGMGITVKTSSSWSGYVSMQIKSDDDVVYVNNYAMPSNGERKFNNLKHYSPMNVGVLIKGIPAGKTMRIDVWIYG